MNVFILCWTAVIIIFELASCAIYIDTKLGRIKGTHMYSRNRRKFNVFLGIPFAEPPIGELRFQNPQPITEPWLGTLDGTKYAPQCPQYLGPLGYLGEEDCLYLNLYTPFLPSANNTRKLPVLVWIFPGKRVFGDAQPFHYGPEYFMDKDMILISANYRLGVTGFLSTEDESAPGNFGLKDQAMVLQWIHEHVAEFGGDPSNVTIQGESSAAVDVGLHLVSPLSKGFFHKVIAESGHAMNYRAIVPKGYNLQQAWRFAKLVGCAEPAIKDSESLVECLRGVPIETLTLSMFGLTYDHVLPHVFFGVNIENDAGPGAFLTEHPMISMDKETTVPWLLGINTDEGSPKILGLYSQTKLLRFVESNYIRILPELLGYSYLPQPNATQLTEALLEKYTGNKPLSKSFEGVSEIFGFASVKYGMIEGARYYKGPTYFYHYDYLHTLPFVRVFEKTMKWYHKEKTGVVHGEELLCLFNQPRMYPPTLDGVDRIMSDLMVDMWYNFVACGNPNGENNHQLWKPVSTPDVEYLYIHNTVRQMRSKPFWEDYEFWKRFGGAPLLTPVMARELFKNTNSFV